MSRTIKGKQRLPSSIALRIAAVAVLTAVTAVLTLLVRIPVPATKGYFNLGDTVIYFTAFTIGPLSALLSGGLGTALADLIGFPTFAPISLFVHGLQGLVAALIAGLFLGAKQRRRAFNPSWLLAAAAGTLTMCGGYFAAESVMLGIGPALVELPFNLLQNVVGAAAGMALSLVVRKAYPPVAELRW
ncbi:MAG: hypothetical protein A2V99_19500 [Spirochaetes bacterium RBG_16_67_19]|nr:MAG: hypothetical protein A2V99_19500 [Spirochaetes bacterium RBG_16_67_19]